MYVTFTETHTLEYKAPADDAWERDSYGLDLEVTGVQVSEPSSAVTQYQAVMLDAQPGDEVHLVVVEYQDGDTFGYSGYWEVTKATKDPLEAYNVCEGVKGPRVNGEWRPWDGYFACLKTAGIQTFTVGR